jgi:hypothetical protein
MLIYLYSVTSMNNLAEVLRSTSRRKRAPQRANVLTRSKAEDSDEAASTSAEKLDDQSGFRKYVKLKPLQPGGGRGSVTDRGGIGEARAGDHARGILCRSEG